MAKSDVRSKYPAAYAYQWSSDSWCVYASRSGPLAGINLGHGRTAAEAWADATRKFTPPTTGDTP